MRRQPVRPRGFTLIELVAAVAIVGVLAALATAGLDRQRRRATLSTVGAELQALLHAARASAVASGHDVAVLVFPGAAAPSGGVGRVVLYEDGNADFFSGGAVNFSGYDPSVLAAGSRSQVLGTLDLPASVTFGPSVGLGASTSLPAPLDAIDVRTDCSFCDAASAARRGAIRFGAGGRATFLPGGTSGASLVGASLSLTSAETGGVLTLVVLAGTGATRLVSGR